MDEHLFPECFEGTDNTIAVLLRLLPFAGCCLCNLLAVLIGTCNQEWTVFNCKCGLQIMALCIHRNTYSTPYKQTRVLERARLGIWQLSKLLIVLCCNGATISTRIHGLLGS